MGSKIYKKKPSKAGRTYQQQQSPTVKEQQQHDSSTITG
jgi:hypothetical protein